MRSTLLPMLLAACEGDPSQAPVPAPVERPSAAELRTFDDLGALGEEEAGITRLVSESTTPTTEGIRVPPPDVYRRTGPLNERLGIGWVTHDGLRAVLVNDRADAGHELSLVDLQGEPIATLPFPGYPDEAWWSPRWSRSGRYLALGTMSGTLLDVTVYDAETGSAREIATLASGFSWSNATDLGVISYWPDKNVALAQPQFHFYRPDLERIWCPIEPSEGVGWVFTGFSANGDVLYREHRRADDGPFEWDPVGERSQVLRPPPPPRPAEPEEASLQDFAAEP
jgi:hypothetical protein